jgi:ABC-2 type transport system permease protein
VRLIRLELARVIRSGGVAAAVALLLGLGIHAAWQGNRRVQAIEDAAAAAETAYRDQLAHLVSLYPPATEAGELLYYLALPAPQPPSPLSALASGRTEIESANLRIRLLALEGQLYEQETLNPRLAAAGHLDLTFVLIALLPLFVIAVTYDIVSGERERGTWGMARLFARPRRLVAAKIGARVILMGGLVTLLAVIGAFLAGIDGDGRAAWAAALVALHSLFWFALCLAVAAGRRSSTANAMILVGAWVALTFLAPAVLSLANAILHPAPEALELTVRQRQGYHEAWDLTKAETMDAFFEDYPQWSDRTVPEDEFTWAWYYAMNHRGDQAARDASRVYRDVLTRRDEWARRWSLLVPPLAARIALDRLASTDLPNQLAYQDAVRRYHERLKAHFQPMLFSAAPIAQVDWERVPAFEPAAPVGEASQAGFPAAAALVLASFGALLVGRIRG